MTPEQYAKRVQLSWKIGLMIASATLAAECLYRIVLMTY